MPSLRAIQNRCIVRRETPAQPHAKLVVPSQLHARQRIGEVLSAGPQATVKTGQKVVFSAMSGVIIEADDGNDVIVLRPSEIMGTING